MTNIEKELELAKFERDMFSQALQISENKLRLERTMRLQCAEDSSMDLKRALAAEEKLLSAEGVILLWQNKCEIAKFERDTLADALRSIIETSDRTYATYSHQQLSKDLDAGRAALALLNKPKAPYA